MSQNYLRAGAETGCPKSLQNDQSQNLDLRIHSFLGDNEDTFYPKLAIVQLHEVGRTQ